tara:strand:- start:894 stop:1217 length:324 start_codon:yes stop_codon:yes gene_type:complete
MKKLTFLFIALINLLQSESFRFNKPRIPKFDKNINYSDCTVTAAGVVFAASFIPYFLDDDIKPNIYKDGLTRGEIIIKHKRTQMSKYLNGDVNKLYDLFPDFEIKIN